MNRFAVCLLLALIAGCAPAAPASPPSAPAKPADSAAQSADAPKAGTGAAPAKPAAAPTDWEAQWNALVTAARQEGKLVVSGPPTPETRKILPARFKERFGIEMEYVALGSTADLLARMEAERASNLYTVDAIMGGAQSLYETAYPKKMLDPLRPVLINPEALDASKWVTGKVLFQDPEQQYIMRASNYLSTHLVVHTEYFKAEEIKSWKDLLNPKYRGKISVYDPTRAGLGWSTANYLKVKLGDDFIRTLYVDQQPAVSRDFRQLSDWMAQGTYPVSLGLREPEINRLLEDGFKIAIVPSPPDAPSPTSAGFGLAVLVNQAPHPNAAKLFVNWIVMKDGQEAWHLGERTVSIRTDVENSWAAAYVIPKPGVQYFDSYGWDFTLASRNPEELEKLKKLIGAS